MAMPLLIPHPSMKNPKTQRPLARGDVYYVGQTIAMVVAVDRYTAEDAAALIEVDYEHLAVEMDMKRALADGAPLVHADVPNNLAAHFVQISGDPDAAFARAEHFTKIEVQVDRSTAAPMECRAVAARWDAVSGELTVWDGTQAPISVRGGPRNHGRPAQSAAPDQHRAKRSRPRSRQPEQYQWNIVLAHHFQEWLDVRLRGFPAHTCLFVQRMPFEIPRRSSSHLEDVDFLEAVLDAFLEEGEARDPRVDAVRGAEQNGGAHRRSFAPLALDLIERAAILSLYAWLVVRVAKGARIRIDQSRINDEVWLPRKLEMSGAASCVEIAVPFDAT